MSAAKKKKKTDKLAHKRENEILLGFIERPLITWLVKILPAWATPDFLTFTGLFACIIVFIGYYLSNFNEAFLWLASFGFILNWFGDSLDGSVARFRKIERPRFGFFIDHTMDALGIAIIFLGMGVSPYTHFSIAVLPLIGYLMMEVQAVSALFANHVFKISYAKLGPTEARAIAIIMNTVLFFLDSKYITLPFGTFLIFDCLLIAAAVLFLVMFVYSVANVGSKLSKIETQEQKQ